MMQSTPTTGVVQEMILSYQQEEGETRVEVGSTAWFAWLEQATSFTFRDEVGHFTAHKTQAGNRRGGTYWRATRRLHGRLSSYYLGPSARLTPEHLRQAAHTLAARASDDHLEQKVASTTSHHAMAQRGQTAQNSSLAPPSPLPRSLNRLLGRTSERDQVLALLRKPQVRLLTLTGPGGVGKTSLALEVAHDLVPDFADGVYFVPLSAISEPAPVLPAIIQALGLRETNARSPLERLQESLVNRSLLLLLDNFEQVLPAAPPLADLLAACPQVKILATSRAALRLQGEHELVISPLALPDLAQLPTRQSLLQYGACALFVERVQAIQPTFQPTEMTVRPIAEICIHLDGLPLAIELAAARTRLLSPPALLSRLSRRLDVLSGGVRDAPERQQTMRDTIAWSYQLLAPEQQKVFRWLSIFAGGCTLEAAEAIAFHAGMTANSILDGVSVLLENHLLRQVEQPDGDPRLSMLETIREFGLERLQHCGELEAARSAHATYFLALAEEAEPQLHGAEHGRWMAQLEHEQENLRAALGFLLEQAQKQAGGLSSPTLREELAGQGEGGRWIEQALRLCIALSWFWFVHGDGREGLSYLMQALEERARGGAALRARALYEAVELGFLHAQDLPLERLAEESLTLYQELGDPVGIATSLYEMGSIARLRSQFAQAQIHLKEAATRFQGLGNHWKQGRCYTEWARVATEQGQYEQAQALLSESMQIYQELGDAQRLDWVRYLQARLLFVQQQDLAHAHRLAEQSLAHFRELGDTLFSVYPLGLLGLIQLEQGELGAARPLLEESLVIGKQTGVETDAVQMSIGLARLWAWQGDAVAAQRLYREGLALLVEFNVYKESVAAILEGLATLEAGQGEPRQAVRLWSAAEALRQAIGAPMYAIHRASYEQALAQVRKELGERAFAAAWANGRSIRPEQVLTMPAPASVTAQVPPQASEKEPLNKPTTYPFGLTAREVEILHLLAQGLSDAQIAEHLVISVRTVNRHTTSIYSKLGVSSRAAATRAAIEHHLL